MSKHRNTIYNALPIVAAAYGEQFGVKVAIGTDTAYTDGETIVVPNVPSDYPNMDVVWGYLTHEAAHVRHTDFTVQRTTELHRYLTNVLEDCRIERAMIQEYPGTAKTLDAVANYMDAKGHYGEVTVDESPSQALGAYCLYWLQGYGVGQDVLIAKADRAAKVLEKMLPSGVLLRLEVMLRKALDLSSTQEAADLASAIISMIEDEQQQQLNTTQSDKDGQSDDGMEDSTQSPAPIQANSESQYSDSSPNESTMGDDQNQGSLSQSTIDQSSGDEEGKDSSGRQDESATADALRQILSASANDLPQLAQDVLKDELQAVQANNGDRSYQTIREALTVPRSSKGHQILSSVKATSNRIRQQLFGIVQAQNHTARLAQRSGKRFDHTRLSRVVSGDPRIFVRTAQKQHPNTAVHLLVDSSTSMRVEQRGRTMADTARDASMALALALEAISGVNPAVTFFGGNRRNRLFSAVRHGQRVSPNAGRFIVPANGTTPMAEALWYAAYQMTKVRESRKLIIVVTDGEPDSKPAVHAITELCENSGIEIIGIGIGTQAVTSLFSKNIVINDVAELRGTLFNLMEQSLRIAA